MERRDIASSLFLLAAATLFVAGSFAFPVWDRYGPGSGFFPLLFGLLLAVLSLALLIDAALRRRRQRRRAEVPSDVPGFANPGKIGIFLVSCAAVYLAMRPLGFPITIFLFLVVTLTLAGQKSFRATLLVAAIASLSIFALFLELNVPLPFGPLQSLATLLGH